MTPLSPPRSTWLTGCPARSRTARTCPSLVEQQRVDRAEIDVHDLLARGAGVGRERAMRLGAALIAEEHLGALVAHEERPRPRRAAAPSRRARSARPPRGPARWDPRTRGRRARRAPLPRGARRRPGRVRSSSSATSRAQTKGRSRPLQEHLHADRAGAGAPYPCASACASDAVGTTSASIPMPPTPARRGSSVTQSRAGLAKRSRCTGAGKPTPARATSTPCDEQSRTADGARVRAGPASVTQRAVVRDRDLADVFLMPAATRLAERTRRRARRARSGRRRPRPAPRRGGGSRVRAARIFWAIVRGGSPARARIVSVSRPWLARREGGKVNRRLPTGSRKVDRARHRQGTGKVGSRGPLALVDRDSLDPCSRTRFARSSTRPRAASPASSWIPRGSPSKLRARRRAVRHHAVGIEFGVVLGSIKRAAESLEAGKAHEVAIGTDKMITLIRTLGDTYFLALAHEARRQPRQGALPHAHRRAQAPRRARLSERRRR